jgi:hypothetical protein
VGRKLRAVKSTELVQKPSQEETKLAAMAWAEFLFDEYQLQKHNRLLLKENSTTMEKLTNHDKLNH